MAQAPPYTTPTNVASGYSPTSSGQLDPTVLTSVKSMYQLLIVTCIWSAMLVPLFILLLFFSSKELRRKPIFIANVLSIMLGLILAGVTIPFLLSQLLNPMAIPLPIFLTYNFLVSSSPLLVESVLLIRLWAIFPFRTTPRKTFLAIFIPVGLLKLARLINAFTYVAYLSCDIRGDRSLFGLIAAGRSRFPNFAIEWFLQVVDNTSASILFLVKLNEVRSFRSRVRGWSSALEALFWIAISNFVIPVVLSIVQLVVIWISRNILIVAPICMVNVYVEIIGVLLATIWATGSQWRGEDRPKNATLVLTTVSIGVDETMMGSTSMAKS